MDMRIPPLKFKIMLESNPLKSTILVGRLGVFAWRTVFCQPLSWPARSHTRTHVARMWIMMSGVPSHSFKIHQRGVQWKQGVVICMMLYTSLLYHTTPIHCTPLWWIPFRGLCSRLCPVRLGSDCDFSSRIAEHWRMSICLGGGFGNWLWLRLPYKGTLRAISCFQSPDVGCSRAYFSSAVFFTTPLCIHEHYPRDPDPEIRQTKATGGRCVSQICVLFKRCGIWVWVSFIVLSSHWDVGSLVFDLLMPPDSKGLVGALDIKVMR